MCPSLPRCAGSLLTLGLLLTLTHPALASPVVRDQELTGSEDSELSGQIASPRPGEQLSVKLDQRPKHGEASVDPSTGAFTYRPAPDFVGDDAFTVRVTSGKTSARARVTLHVTAENDAPKASPLQLSTYEDSAAKGQLAASDVDRDILTYRVVAPPAHGSASVDPRKGAVTYRPAPDYNGADSFTVEVSDGALTGAAEVSVKVVAVNDAPLVRAKPQPCREDEPCAARIDASDVDGDALTYKLTAKPKHGELTLDPESGAYTFTPARDWHGEDAFSVDVSDGKLKASAKLSLQVAAVNDAPVASAPGISTREDEPAGTQGKASDVDGDALTWRIARAPAHGEAWVDARSGAASYRPAPDYNGADAFTVEVSDGAAATAVEVSVTVTAVNDAPLAKSAAHALDEDTKLDAQVAASDVDGDTLDYAKGKDVAHGTLTLSPQTGAFTYAPARDYHGPDSFTVRVSDGSLATEVVVRLSVKPVNDAPVAQPLSLASDEDQPAYGAAAATDVDGDALRWSVGAPPAHGEARVDAKTGAVTFVPARDYHGPDAFTLSVSDGKAAAEASVAVVLAPVDDPPFVKPLTVASLEDAAAQGALPGGDVDGDPLTFRVLSQPRLGAVWSDGSTFRFQPAPDANGDDAFTFDVTDGRTVVRGTVMLHVEPVNDAPVVADLQLSTREDEAVEGQLRAFDADGDPLTFSVQGPASVDAKGKLRFEPKKDQYGAVTFTVTASDGKLTSQPAKVMVSIAPVNDAPVAKPSALSTDEDTPARGTLFASDVDLDAVTYALAQPPSHGTVEVLDPAKGIYAFHPAPNWFGQDTFSFRATDEKGATNEAAVSVTIAAVNDAPVAEDDHVTAPCLGSVSGRLHGFDRESRSLTFRIVSEPRRGRVKLDEKTGDFVYYSEGREDDEPVSFGFVVFDGQASSEPAELFVHPAGSCARNNG